MSPASLETRRPRALVIAYDFPPHAAIGTMRTLRLVQRLAADGWDVRVLTSAPRTFRPGTPADEALLACVPASVAVIRAGVVRGLDALKGLLRPVRRRESSAAVSGAVHHRAPRNQQGSLPARALGFLEAALSIPDHESGWLVPAIARGLWTCRSWRPDVIYSSAPPWTGQVVAWVLASVVGRPWMADFRDPWARAPARMWRPFVSRANGALERMVVTRADAILVVTRANRDEFTTFYGPALGDRFHLVPNGCDPSEFAGLHASSDEGRFVLLHAGTLYGPRNPLPLLRALARAVGRGVIARDRFRLRLLGLISLDVDVTAECRRLGIDDLVEIVPRVTRGESLQQMVSAAALLLVQPVTTVSVPGKAYEYLAAGRPILAVTEEGETAELVRASGIGVAVQPGAPTEDIETALLEVMAIASRSYVPAPAALYDGRIHAVTTAALLQQLAARTPHAVAARARVAAEPVVRTEHQGP
jgi:glycosyltransferase involved in cell wall biosynthesis